MQAVVGEPVEAQLAVAGDPGDLGARIEVPITRAIASAWQPAEIDPATGAWAIELDSPIAAGEYLLVWRTSDPEPPAFEVFVPLTAIAARAVAGDDVAEPADWTPTADEVAAVTPAYTRGGFDDDREDAGAEQGTYTEDTSPTRAHVEGLIAAAVDEVAGRVGVPIPARHAALARVTAVWHAAAAISGGKIPADTDDARGEYRSHITNYRACLDELTELCRTKATRLH